MGKNRRVVVTGMGAITPIGNSVEEFWNGIKEGKTGFGPITYFDTADYRCKLAAEVKDFDPAQYMDKKSARRMEQFCQFAVAAAGQAISDAGLDMEQEDPYISIAYGLKGKSLNVVTACATGTHSIGEAYRTIQYGDVDVMIAGGTESSITPIGIAGFSALTALSFSEDPERASIPFDKERNGFVMGEGSAIVVLEELEHAKRRGAKIYAELTGYGCSSDAYHITSPAEDGSGAATAMLNALKDGGVAPEELTYINAHGTSTHHNDLFETRAIKLAFGEHAYDLKINSTKSMVGHLLGAAGAVEFVTCVKEIQKGYIHRTVGLRETEEELDLNYCRDSYKEEVPYALTNSLGFGGHNASLLLKKYTE